MEVRLIGYDAPWAGIVEVKYAGIWGTICDELFGAREAGVVCKMLGYTAASEDDSVRIRIAIFVRLAATKAATEN
ncbi:hypothetical protein CHS0354_012520 [Potamilus streckersoni]|uniref:SRCR domain-containing protein n=1 Tax=Potamilus streckersoni TaxID=2493646 RepID=A0AAE0SWP6_9BIVA|nr:hypothetical protein CHS0354_012520 [Potamilus streckersoni]